MSQTGEYNEQGNILYMAGLLAAGISLGFGLIGLLFSFGYEGGPINQTLSEVGFSAIDNLTFLSAADYSFGFIVFGALVMVVLNATAWKRTGGY